MCSIVNGGGCTLGPVGGGGTGPPNRGETPNLAVFLTHCGRLILRKISNFDATRCQILRLKCTEFDFRCGRAPETAVGAYSTPPDP